MHSSEKVDLLAAALAAAQAEFEAVPKTATNPFFHSKYANLPSVVLAASPILARHGLAVTQFPDFDGEVDLLTTRLMHTSGQWLESSMRLYMAKATPQDQGSAITYARRYAYSAAIGIVTEEDDDGHAASQPRPSTAAKKRPAPRSHVDQSKIDPGEKTPKSQLDYIKALFKRDHGIEDEGEMCLLATQGVKREITALDVLTKREADMLLDYLKALKRRLEPTT